MKEKRTLKTITPNDTISYTGMTQSWGRAEFVFCPIFVKGILKRIYIYPKQQKRDDYWVLKMPKGYKCDRIYPSGRGANFGVWMQFWCQEHETFAQVIYVPDDSDEISFCLHFGNSLDIRFGKRSKS